MITYRNTAAAAAIGIAMLLSTARRVDAQDGQTIERLSPPKAAPPPGSEATQQDADEDLERKRMQRRTRDKSMQPAPPPYRLELRKELEKEALVPRDKALMFEAALVAGTVATRGARERYTAEPTVHLNVFFRYDAKNRAGKLGPWFGFRLAPFTGTGFYEKRPGSYGLTYFGPMIGVGKIDLAPPVTVGTAGAETLAEPKVPAANGWVLGTGITAVSRSGRANEGVDQSDSDFSTKGVAFDGPGLWVEARWLRIFYDALGFNLLVGVQSGQGKEFIYTGVGFSGWH